MRDVELMCLGLNMMSYIQEYPAHYRVQINQDNHNVLKRQMFSKFKDEN